MSLTLSIQHKIYLTREERYRLHAGESLEVIGVSVPVWYTESLTSEPAREVFCKYYLENSKIETPIVIGDDGYHLVIPYQSHLVPADLPDDVYRNLSIDELEVYYKLRKRPITSQNLLDPKDGGASCILYSEHNKVKHMGQFLHIVHAVALEDVQRLLSTIEITNNL